MSYHIDEVSEPEGCTCLSHPRPPCGWCSNATEEQIEAAWSGDRPTSGPLTRYLVNAWLEDNTYATLPGCSCGGLNNNRAPWCDVCQAQIDKIDAWCLSKGLGQDHYYRMLDSVFSRTADPVDSVRSNLRLHELRTFYDLIGHKLQPWQEQMIRSLETQKPLADSTLTLETLAEARQILDKHAGCFPVPEEDRTPPAEEYGIGRIDHWVWIKPAGDALMKAEDDKGFIDHGPATNIPWPDEIMPEPKPTEPTDHELPEETLSTIAKAFR